MGRARLGRRTIHLAEQQSVRTSTWHTEPRPAQDAALHSPSLSSVHLTISRVARRRDGGWEIASEIASDGE